MFLACACPDRPLSPARRCQAQSGGSPHGRLGAGRGTGRAREWTADAEAGGGSAEGNLGPGLYGDVQTRVIELGHCAKTVHLWTSLRVDVE